MTLPESFKALSWYPQFVNWGLIDKQDGAKPSKSTINAYTKRLVDAHDRSNWMDADEAFRRSNETGYGVGFVFTKNDPFFFIDIDNCRNADGSWSQVAIDVCNLFPGAGMEISQSGKGLHIFGCGKAPDGFKKKNMGLGLEFYDDLRFVALGLNNPTGDVWLDWTAQLNYFRPAYFEPSVDIINPQGWTTEPRPEWNGPVDDDQLIEKMLNSGGAASLFGGRATVRMLWEASPSLGDYFPDPEQGRDFDHSAADAALMSHLAFWTGADCARMDRLFRRSGLMRDKYGNRPQYAHDTIIKSVNRCGTVYTAGPPKNQITNNPVPDNNQPYEVMMPDEQVEYFENCCYVADKNKVYTPNGQLLKPEAFKSMYGGKVFMIGLDKKTDDAFKAFTQNRRVTFPKADSTCFRPDINKKIIEREGRKLLNTYTPMDTNFIEGDCTPFHNHMGRLFPDDTDRMIMYSYLAAMVQHPGSKFQWCPVIQGGEGNGKSWVGYIMEQIIGERFSHKPNARELGDGGSKFTGWIEGRLLIVVEEIKTDDKQELIEALKPLVTNNRVEIQGKGQDQVTGDNYANFIMFTNYKNAININKTSRRYAVFWTPQQKIEDLDVWEMTGDYFPKLYEWIKRQDGHLKVGHFLKHFQIPDQYNPATLAHRAPVTSVTQAVVEQSLGVVEQEIIECIESERVGFRGGFISSTMLDKFMAEKKLERRVARNKRKELLENIGYVPHPNLPNGRAPSNLNMEDNTRPIIYVKARTPHADLSPSEVLENYKKFQNYIC